MANKRGGMPDSFGQTKKTKTEEEEQRIAAQNVVEEKESVISVVSYPEDASRLAIGNF
jgi:hypothetical protein